MTWQEARAQFPTDTATMAAAGIGTVAISLVTGANEVLLAALGAAFIMDQCAGMLRAYIEDPAHWYDSRVFLRGLAKKVLLVFAALVAASMDMVAQYLPALGPGIAHATPVTKSVLFLLILGQWGSILRNVQKVKAGGLAVEFLTRRMDAAQLGVEPPERRHYDAEAIHEEKELTATNGDSFHEAAKERDRQPSKPRKRGGRK